jgi:uncharacterized protein (TIGR02246 family)
MDANPAIVAEIQQFLADFTDAIRIRDGDAVLERFALDHGVTVASAKAGEVARGPEELRALVTGLLTANVRHAWRWDDVRISGDAGIAIVFAQGEVSLEHDEGGVSATPHRMTMVLRKHEGRWLIHHYHGSRPVPD